jgi:predicted metalloprotease
MQQPEIGRRRGETRSQPERGLISKPRAVRIAGDIELAAQIEPGGVKLRRAPRMRRDPAAVQADDGFKPEIWSRLFGRRHELREGVCR